MERRGQQEMGNNPMRCIPPQIIHESSVKLPLAPRLSTPPDYRRPNAMVSTRRGSSIFSPTRTLDQPYNPPPHHHHQLSPLPSPQQEDSASPDPDPTSPNTGSASNSKNPAPLPPQPRASPPQSAVTTAGNINSVKYKECLRNHAVSMGAHVVDGCGEFMPSGEDGTLEALKCAACDCHRNFHRKEVDGEPSQQPHHYTYSNNGNSHRGGAPPSLHGQTPIVLPAPSHLKHHFAASPTPPTMVNFGENSDGAAEKSSSEDLDTLNTLDAGGHAVAQPSFSSGSKKRFRTKFSQDQKDRMHEFAMKLGWRIQKQDEEQVQQFCREVGVKRQVFKVWMHNNKQAMKKMKEKNLINHRREFEKKPF